MLIGRPHLCTAYRHGVVWGTRLHRKQSVEEKNLRYLGSAPSRRTFEFVACIYRLTRILICAPALKHIVLHIFEPLQVLVQKDRNISRQSHSTGKRMSSPRRCVRISTSKPQASRAQGLAAAERDILKKGACVEGRNAVGRGLRQGLQTVGEAAVKNRAASEMSNSERRPRFGGFQLNSNRDELARVGEHLLLSWLSDSCM